MKQLSLFPLVFKSVEELLLLYPTTQYFFMYTNGSTDYFTIDYIVALDAWGYYPEHSIKMYEYMEEPGAYVLDEHYIQPLPDFENVVTLRQPPLYFSAPDI